MNEKSQFGIEGPVTVKNVAELDDDEFFTWYTSLYGVPQTSAEISKYVSTRGRMRGKSEADNAPIDP